jgi:hypothetical protein
VEISGAPGETIQETIKVRNESASELAVQTNVKDFIVKDEAGTPVPVEEDVSGRWSLASWINVSPQQTLLKPKEMQVMSMVVKIPEDALPGGHYAMVLHHPDFSGTIGGTGSKLAQNVGTLVYLTVEGDIRENATITEFKTDKEIAEYGPVEFTTTIENQSDVHIRPQASIKVYDMLDNLVEELPLEEQNIFPFKSRTYENILEGKWRLGRYKAILDVAYGEADKSTSAMLYFWIIPWTVIALILVIIIMLIIIIILLKNRKRSSKKASPPPVEELG